MTPIPTQLIASLEGSLPNRSYFYDRLDVFLLERRIREKHKRTDTRHLLTPRPRDDESVKMYVGLVLQYLERASSAELKELLADLYQVHPDDAQRVLDGLIASGDLVANAEGDISAAEEGVPCSDAA